MVDGDTFKLEPQLAARIRDGAAAHGVSPETFLSEAVQAFMVWDADMSDAPLTEADHDLIAEETVRKGDGVPWEDFRLRLLGFGQAGGQATD